jgi:hypothetical protein
MWKEVLVELNVERAWKDYKVCLGQYHRVILFPDMEKGERGRCVPSTV